MFVNQKQNNQGSGDNYQAGRDINTTNNYITNDPDSNRGIIKYAGLLIQYMYENKIHVDKKYEFQKEPFEIKEKINFNEISIYKKDLNKLEIEKDIIEDQIKNFCKEKPDCDERIRRDILNIYETHKYKPIKCPNKLILKMEKDLKDKFLDYLKEKKIREDECAEVTFPIRLLIYYYFSKCDIFESPKEDKE